MFYVMYRFQRDLEGDDHLLERIYRNRGFHEVFPRLSGPPGIIMTGVRTGETRRIDGSYRNDFTPGIEEFQGFIGFVEIITFPYASVIHSLSPIFAPGALSPGPPRAIVLDRGGESERSISR